MAAALVAALLGSPGYYLSFTLSGGFVVQPTIGWVAREIVYFLTPFFAILALRLMRQKLIIAELPIANLVPEGEEKFEKIFGGVSRNVPPFIVALIAFPVPSFLYIVGNYPLPQLVILLFQNFFLSLVYSTVGWVYLRSIWGLYLLGGLKLKLRPYYQDRILGLRPVGSLALSLALVYFLMMALLAVVNSYLFDLILVAPVMALGIIFFFLPLGRVHRQMLEIKHAEELKLDEQFEEMLRAKNASGDGKISSVDELAGLMRNDILSKRLASTSSWPFDTVIIGQFTVVVLSVMAILVAELITATLKG